MKRFFIPVFLLLTLAGCDLLGGGKEDTPELTGEWTGVKVYTYDDRLFELSFVLQLVHIDGDVTGHGTTNGNATCSVTGTYRYPKVSMTIDTVGPIGSINFTGDMHEGGKEMIGSISGAADLNGMAFRFSLNSTANQLSKTGIPGQVYWPGIAVSVSEGWIHPDVATYQSRNALAR